MPSLREAQKTWEALKALKVQGRRVALLILISVRGSAYRRPGAKMVMADDGTMVGTLSGGCLEGDLFGYAQTSMNSQMPSLHHYDLTEDDMWGLGIGCKGQVSVWIEPIGDDSVFWDQFGVLLGQGEAFCWQAELPVGDRGFITEGEGPLLPYNTTMWEDAFYREWLTPPPRLVIAGAGHDAIPLAQIAHQAGFEILVFDPRLQFNNAHRFPLATHHIHSMDGIAPDVIHNAFWVIMNHQQRRDETAIHAALAANARYIGVLGPLSRTREMIKNIGVPPAEDLSKVFAPVGLNIGAETVDEVAISIVSELLQVRNDTHGGHLNGKDKIHAF